MTIYSNVQLSPGLMEMLLRRLGPHRLVQSVVPTASNLQVGQPDPAAREADVAWGQPAVDDILRNPRLRFIQLTTAGYDRYDRADLREAIHARGGALCNASSVYTEPCAEHVLCQMMAGARRLPDALRNQFADRRWPQVEIRSTSRLLVGQTVLIAGLGAIGQTLVELLTPFHMKIIATRRKPRGDEPVATYSQENLDALLPQADHVVNLLPGGAATKELFNATRFARMKRGAVFYNIGRGSTVDQPALIEAMHAGQLGGAYLDVTTPEPLPADHELWTTPNVFITPHSAGGFDQEFEAHIELLVRNLERFGKGEKLVDRVV